MSKALAVLFDPTVWLVGALLIIMFSGVLCSWYVYTKVNDYNRGYAIFSLTVICIVCGVGWPVLVLYVLPFVLAFLVPLFVVRHMIKKR